MEIKISPPKTAKDARCFVKKVSEALAELTLMQTKEMLASGVVRTNMKTLEAHANLIAIELFLHNAELAESEK